MKHQPLTAMRLVAAAFAIGVSTSLVVATNATAAPAFHSAPVHFHAEIPGASEIDKKYTEFGGEASPLGAPSTETVAAGAGVVRDYVGGAIYYSTKTGAHVMYGLILDKFRELGGASGEIGFPTTDESELPGGVGRYNDFATPGGASIYWTPANGASLVRGPLLAGFKESGGLTGAFGAPLAAQTDANGTLSQKFANGTLSWNKTAGYSSEPAALAEKLKGFTPPSADSVLEAGPVANPDGTLTYPDGSVKQTDGTYKLPDGTIVQADGSLKLADGSVVLPEGAERQADGSLKYANGIVRKADGTLELPEGAEKLPDGLVKLADGTVVYPSGGAKLADGTFALPKPGKAATEAPAAPTATAEDAESDGSGFPWMWVIPIAVLGLLALLGLAFFLKRRGSTGNAQLDKLGAKVGDGADKLGAAGSATGAKVAGGLATTAAAAAGAGALGVAAKDKLTGDATGERSFEAPKLEAASANIPEAPELPEPPAAVEEGGISGIIGSIKDKVGDLAEDAGDFAGGLKDKVGDVVEGASDKLGDAKDAVADKFADLTDKDTSLGDKLGGAVSSAGSAVGGAVSSAGDAASGAASSAGEVSGSAVSSAGEAASSAGAAAAGAVGSAGETAAGALGSAGEATSGAVGKASHRLAEGVTAAGDKLGEAVSGGTSATQRLISKAKHALKRDDDDS